MAQPWQPAGPGTPVRSYRTRFQLDEDPISEGGMWINGKTDGIDWADVVTEDGVAHGGMTRMAVAERRAEQGNLDARRDGRRRRSGTTTTRPRCSAGDWGRNQHVKATVFSRNQTEEYFQEVEIRLRSTIAPHSCTGYEVFWRCLKTDERLRRDRQVEREGRDWTSLARSRGRSTASRTATWSRPRSSATSSGRYINGVEVLSATDARTAPAVRGSGSTSAAATPTSTMGSRPTRWKPTTTEQGEPASGPRPGGSPGRGQRR